MLHQAQTTLPAEIRDFPEWHHGRETYAVWILALEEATIRDKFEAAREHLSAYLLEPYRRQPHITLFVCGFLVDAPQYDDDFSYEQLRRQMQALEGTNFPAFEIEIGGLNSFASAPFLEVNDPEGGIVRLREILLRSAREFRTAPYRPHLTVGLYAGAFPSEEVATRMAKFPVEPIRRRVEEITLATYQANEFAGSLSYQYILAFKPGSQDI